MTRYGVVGLGIMGTGIASHLADSLGWDVGVYSRSGAESRPGWTPHTSATSLARHSDVVVVAVPTADAVEEVLFADPGFLDALADGVVANIATVGPDAAKRIGSRVLERGVQYVDAPVLGSREAARTGALTVLAAGAPETRSACAELFEAMGKRTLAFDEIGQASAAKLLFNALLGISAAAVTEVRAMARTLGLPDAFIQDVVFASPVAAPVMGALAQRMSSGDGDVHFPLEWMLKDLRLARGVLDRREGTVLNAATERFEAAQARGLGRRDLSAVDSTELEVGALTS